MLGDAQLLGPGGPLALERKTAGLLAWLALEGPTPKYRLAGILWPESGETRARNNMRQLLRRLRVATGAELLPGGDVIALAEGVVADAAELEAHAFAGRHAQVLALEGKLLGTLEFDDCSEFDEWVRRADEALHGLRRRAAEAEADRLEKEGHLGEALAVTERLLSLEPHAEEVFRRLMKLHHLLGNRGAALDTFARCRRMLREELDVEPMPETLALARDIERGHVKVRTPRGAPALPLSVLRPPVLVGREREWALLERAWEAKQAIYLRGEPGVGKSRLAVDFAASRGSYQLLWARPGDRDVPYSTYQRHVRLWLRERPELLDRTEPWVRRELSRLLPEVAEPGTPLPPPLASEGERQRFLMALSDMLCLGLEGVDTLITDDFQFMDRGTHEVGYVTLTRFASGGSPFRFIDCYRRGELEPLLENELNQYVAVDMVIVLDLQPLGESSVAELLGTLELPGAGRLAHEMLRYTGGNPLFITETLKHLVEQGSLERGWPERLPPPGRVRQLIQHRLERLTPEALLLAQVASLALTHFSLELAGEVLERSPLSFQAALQELEAAQILRGERFTHDLVQEALRGTPASSLAALLHRRLAAALERRNAPAIVVAQHWLAGGEEGRARPLLLAAIEAEEVARRPAEAAALRARFAELLASTA
ncbi:MAG TPA: BTAD domain-containing putative transcriptional regulator [Archangium sp.]|nr:BTAD domain-containing putative transcriptional regulator [Archangium sp.]